MNKIKWNKNWKYWTEKDAFALVWNVPEDAKQVTLPHDAMLEQSAYATSKNGGNTGFRDGAVYHYVKQLHMDEEDAKKTWMLHFEGVYMNAMVYVNEELAAKCPYGYTGFYVSLNDYLRYGEDNEIRVIVRNSAMPNSRWYSGGGIYRDVYLLSAEETYVVPEEVTIVTETLEEDQAVVKVSTTLKNRSSRHKNLRLVTEIQNESGKVVAWEEAPITIFEQEQRELTCRMVVEQPDCWSEETPVLNTCVSKLYQGETLLDENQERFGIRTLQADAKKGFRVNGKTVKLRGACIHHDSGILGAATFYEAEHRRVRLLKEAGFNAIRMSHHPAAPVLLDACDELGMYVMDESFDMWNRCKSDNDYGLFFDKWWKQDVEAMVKKDRNHPSVILYSVGNEISEIGTPHGAKICNEMSETIKQLDASRFTLASINGVFAAGDKIPQIMGDLAAELEAKGEPKGNVNDFMTMMDAHMDRIVVHQEITNRLDAACAGTDIAGYNYMAARYELDKKLCPNRIIVGSETYPPEIAHNWKLIQKCNNVIGDFTWTGWDYIGEAGVGIPAYEWGEGGFGAGFPCQLAYSGDIDITGFRRPASYLREIVFGLRKEPYIAVQNPSQYGKPVIKTPWVISDADASWTYPGYEGKPVVVEVYAPGEEVELFLNGKSIGKKQAGEAVGYRVLFETTYEPGCLEAVAYENQTALGKITLATAGESKLQAKAEEDINGELVYIDITNADESGVVDCSKACHIKARVQGAKECWLGSGNPKPLYNYLDLETDLWKGRALLVIRRQATEDTIQVQIEGADQTVTLQVSIN